MSTPTNQRTTTSSHRANAANQTAKHGSVGRQCGVAPKTALVSTTPTEEMGFLATTQETSIETGTIQKSTMNALEPAPNFLPHHSQSRRHACHCERSAQILRPGSPRFLSLFSLACPIWCLRADQAKNNPEIETSTGSEGMPGTHPAPELNEMPLSKDFSAVKAAISLLESRGILAVHRFKQDGQLASMIVRHMAPRLGLNVYQVASFSLIMASDGIE